MSGDGGSRRPFVVLGTQRSGTVLVETLLSSHPDAHCWGEVLLGMDGPTAASYPSMLHRRRRLRHLWQMAASGSALRPGRVIARAYAERPEPRVGIRVMYNQLRGREERVLAAHDPDVVHVVRENVLRQYVSLQQMRARQATLGARTAHSTERIEFDPVVIDPAAVLAFVESRHRRREEIARRFSARTVLELRYERDIEGDPAYGERAGDLGDLLQDALGLRRVPLTSPLRKTGSRDLARSVSNLDAVRARFATTPYAWMLER